MTTEILNQFKTLMEKRLKNAVEVVSNQNDLVVAVYSDTQSVLDAPLDMEVSTFSYVVSVYNEWTAVRDDSADFKMCLVDRTYGSMHDERFEWTDGFILDYVGATKDNYTTVFTDFILKYKGFCADCKSPQMDNTARCDNCIIEMFRYYRKLPSDMDTCSICMDNSNTVDKFFITKCNHIFHRKCVNKAVLTKPACPLCRGKLIHARDFKIYTGKDVGDWFS
jgi:hypothetical protein